jgi:environmental stress-induced protein Ves
MQILRHADYKRMPWKNGLGVTEEVIAFPPGTDISTFGWRLSIAHVGADGPFSVFAGIDRTIALLDGDGLLLDLPNGRTMELSPKGEPFAFSGDVEISSRNKGGPTIDLNIMTRRGKFEHRMRRIGPGAIEIMHPETILVFNTPTQVSYKDECIDLQRFDALLANPADSLLDIGPAAEVLMIEISAPQVG